jgi:RNA polymerase sigma-70 factor (ECF subfamily)
MAASAFLPFRRRGADDFAQRVGPHLDSLYRLAYRFTGNRHDAEDLVQELLLRLYDQRRRLQDVEELRPWLARSLYHLYIDVLRRHQRTPFAHLDQDDEEHITRLHDTSLQDYDDLDYMLQSALDHLNEKQRSLILFHDVEGYTLVELGQILNQPVGTLKSRLHRARARLRDYLREQQVEPFSSRRRVNG